MNANHVVLPGTSSFKAMICQLGPPPGKEKSEEVWMRISPSTEQRKIFLEEISQTESVIVQTSADNIALGEDLFLVFRLKAE